MSNIVNLQNKLDHASLTGIHWNVLIWCFMIIIFDGYDLAIAGAALPSIMEDMGVTPTNAGFMMSSALFGMMIGAIFFGTLADRIGRRWTIAICLFLFSAFTAAAGLTSEPISFSIMRFIAGLGIGGVMPNLVAHMAEYAPRRIRATMVTLMFSGYAIGGMVAAILGKGLIASYGWESVFFAAGLPVLLVPFVIRSMAESPTYLIRSSASPSSSASCRPSTRATSPRTPTSSRWRRSAPAGRAACASAACSRTVAASARSCSGFRSSCACSWSMRSARGWPS